MSLKEFRKLSTCIAGSVPKPVALCVFRVNKVYYLNVLVALLLVPIVELGPYLERFNLLNRCSNFSESISCPIFIWFTFIISRSIRHI